MNERMKLLFFDFAVSDMESICLAGTTSSPPYALQSPSAAEKGMGLRPSVKKSLAGLGFLE